MSRNLIFGFFLFGIGLFLLGIGVGKVSIETPKGQTLGEQSKQTPSPLAKQVKNSNNSEELFKVLKVIDGDTIDLQISGQKETVRLIGIDAPESGNCFGSKSTEKARELLSSQFIDFEQDPSQGERDKYGRLLGYIFLKDGINFNETMIRNGFAKEYTYNKPYKYQSLFKNVQLEAQTNKRGLWADNACSASQQTTVQQSTNQPSGSVQQNNIQGAYTCDCSKLCSQISTCDEAYYQFNQCGCIKRDADGDGVPCESLCK